jgi:hypothetical protein
MKTQGCGRKWPKGAWVVAAACGFMLSIGIQVGAQMQTTPEIEKPAAYTEKTVTITASVQAIDLGKRIVKVKGGPKDQVFELKVGKEVKNLDRLKVGDRVVIHYLEAIAVRVMKPGERAAAFEKKVESEVPGTEVRQTTVTARIEYIDRTTNNVYLKWPGGVTVGVRARGPGVLDNFNDGDWIEITYTDTLAISIEKVNNE